MPVCLYTPSLCTSVCLSIFVSVSVALSLHVYMLLYLSMGVLAGTFEQLTATVRSTLLQLSRRVPAVLMHPSWPLLRRAWLTAASCGKRTNDFTSALVLLANLIRRRLYCPLWSESLGEIFLHFSTHQLFCTHVPSSNIKNALLRAVYQQFITSRTFGPRLSDSLLSLC